MGRLVRQRGRWEARPSAIRRMTRGMTRFIGQPSPQRAWYLPCQWIVVPPSDVEARSTTAR
ncbi:hypothetical protein EDD30_0449 [Couchioplanes caeruleus]|uniref:Uncharacterized protein n=2 Tax=Couchioplanes caeruleus TaxID=56438 RepID=A0A1K0GUX3_9ACTN|nr:hypothetical protein BG844_16405 [Couchioplanes caeruleus subsp. caeruleus]ROP27754.1 hypothetical protein EDD30_0449 [Couchioplanes caeruleus]